MTANTWATLFLLWCLHLMFYNKSHTKTCFTMRRAQTVALKWHWRGNTDGIINCYCPEQLAAKSVSLHYLWVLYCTNTLSQFMSFCKVLKITMKIFFHVSCVKINENHNYSQNINSFKLFNLGISFETFLTLYTSHWQF